MPNDRLSQSPFDAAHMDNGAFRFSNEGGDRERDSLMPLTADDPFRWTGPGRLWLAPDLAAGEIGFGRPADPT
jgi:hypothetical protein